METVSEHRIYKPWMSSQRWRTLALVRNDREAGSGHGTNELSVSLREPPAEAHPCIETCEGS